MKFYLNEEARQKGITPLMAPRRGDAGYDIRSLEEVQIAPSSQEIIRTGLHLSIPLNWVGLLRDRSSIAAKRVYVHSGVIDASYRGEVKVILENRGEELFVIQVNDKIVQMIVVPHYTLSPELVEGLDHLGTTRRGQDGFGSTGSK